MLKGSKMSFFLCLFSLRSQAGNPYFEGLIGLPEYSIGFVCYAHLNDFIRAFRFVPLPQPSLFRVSPWSLSEFNQPFEQMSAHLMTCKCNLRFGAAYLVCDLLSSSLEHNTPLKLDVKMLETSCAAKTPTHDSLLGAEGIFEIALRKDEPGTTETQSYPHQVKCFFISDIETMQTFYAWQTIPYRK